MAESTPAMIEGKNSLNSSKLLEAQFSLSLHASPGLVPEASSPIKDAWKLWNPPHLPRGMLGRQVGGHLSYRRGSAWEALLMLPTGEGAVDTR